MFRLILVAAFATLIVALLVVVPPASAGENDSQQQIDLKQARFSDCVFFFACGSIHSDTGTIVQVRLDGTVINSVTVPGKAAGIAIAVDRTLYGVITKGSGAAGADGRVFQVDRTGTVKKITKMRSPTDIAIDPRGDKVIIADQWDGKTFVLEPTTGQLTEHLPVIIAERHSMIPSLFLKFTCYGDILMSSTEPRGVFLTSGGSDPAGLPGEKMLHQVGFIASGPQSGERWAATQPKTVHLFEGSQERLKLRYPTGTTVYAPGKTYRIDRSRSGSAGGLLAFAPDNNLMLPLYRKEDSGQWECWLYCLDLTRAEELVKAKAKTDTAWTPLFRWDIADASAAAAPTQIGAILFHPPILWGSAEQTAESDPSLSDFPGPPRP